MHGQSNRSELDRPTEHYRVWIVARGDWHPMHAQDTPPRAQAVEPAEECCMSAAEAEAYIAGFNERALVAGSPYWAMRVPVRSLFESAIATGQWLGD